MVEKRVSLQLWLDSWQNLFECLHAKGTTINSKGNFWAAVQELERQFNPDMSFISEFQMPRDKRQIEIDKEAEKAVVVATENKQ